MNPEELAALGSTSGQQGAVPTLSANTPGVTNIPDSSSSQSDQSGDRYEDYTILPKGAWPPPMYIKKNVTPDERFYMEHRWHSQWSFFDKKATENKNLYLRYQWIIGVGSVAVPVLVGINPADNVARDVLYFLTVSISLAVAISAAIENIYKYGDNWRSYRQAAEELKQEKSLYDARAGRYSSRAGAFVSFVERCEEICAQQNGRWVQSVEKQQAQSAEHVAEILEKYQKDEANSPQGVRDAFSGASTPSFQVGYQGAYSTATNLSGGTSAVNAPVLAAGVAGAVAALPVVSANGSAPSSVVAAPDISQYDVPMGDVSQYDVPMGDVSQYDVPIDEASVDIG